MRERETERRRPPARPARGRGYPGRRRPPPPGRPPRKPEKLGGPVGRGKKPDKKPDMKTQEMLEFLKNRANMPVIRIRGNTRFIIYANQFRDFFTWQLVATLVIILLGGLAVLAVHAYVTGVESQIVSARNRLMRYQQDVFTLEAQLDKQFSNEEVEEIASDVLGMHFPDPTQVIEIHVPRLGGATLNTIMRDAPDDEYVADGLLSFIAGVLNRVFGGGT